VGLSVVQRLEYDAVVAGVRSPATPCRKVIQWTRWLPLFVSSRSLIFLISGPIPDI